MKPTADIVAERPLAKHAEELIKPRAAPPELDETASYFGTALARALRAELSSLMGGAEFSVTLSAPVQGEAGVVFGQYKASASSLLIAGIPGLPSLYASMSRRDTLAICDRAYGGIGAVSEDAESADLPGSAGLMLDQLGSALAKSLAKISGTSSDVHVARRGDSLERLATFGSRADTLSFTATITEEERESWTITLLGLAKGFTAFMAALDQPASAGKSNSAPSGPDDEPFSGIPLPLRAVLCDMPISAMRIADLAPGDMLPITMRREVPLLANDDELARGTVGAVDDQIALKITQISNPKGHS